MSQGLLTTVTDGLQDKEVTFCGSPFLPPVWERWLWASRWGSMVLSQHAGRLEEQWEKCS